MPQTQLLDLIESGDFESFDNRCLELLQGGEIKAAELVKPFDALRAKGEDDRLKTLTPMVFESLQWEADPRGNIELLKAALGADPKNPQLRKHLIESYQRVYGDQEGYNEILTASGLEAGRAFRNASKVMEFGFELQIGDVLIGRLDDNAVEVAEIDRSNALFTLRRESRRITIPANELARDYDQVDNNDFRVLRQLYPDRLNELIESDPVAVVVGLIRANDGPIDQELLRDELVPRYMDSKSWSKWWTKTRTKLKRDRHILLEGRAPVVISYTKKGQTIEDEARAAFSAAKSAPLWLDTIDNYYKESEALKSEPDAALVAEFVAKLKSVIELARARRPLEALEAALVLIALNQRGVADTDDGQELAVELVKESADPFKLLSGLPSQALWSAAFPVIKTARPDEYATLMAKLIRTAPAALLDHMAEEAVAGEALNGVQKSIEKALDNPVEYPEMVYWMWKGPKPIEGLHFPADELLYEEIMDTLLALGRNLNPSADVMRVFRTRMRAALSLRDHGKVREVYQASEYSRGVTLKSQLRRLEGMGETIKVAMLNALRDVHPDLWAIAPTRRLEAWENEDVIFATTAGIRRREAERDELLNVKMRENSKRIGDAAELGDLSENSEYKFALEERDMLRAQLAVMNNELSISEPIDPAGINTERVEIGTTVKLKHLASGNEREITLFGPFDSNVEQGIYNYKAPFAVKILGLTVGDKATLNLDNSDEEYEVVAIRNGLES
jgi:transcription elongation factor GreA